MLKKFLLGRGINRAQEVTAKFARHGLTTLGGSAMSAGYVTDSELTLLAGALSTVLGVLWSVARAYLSDKL